MNGWSPPATALLLFLGGLFGTTVVWWHIAEAVAKVRRERDAHAAHVAERRAAAMARHPAGKAHR